MPRSFDMSTDYAESVEAVLRAFSDEQYWLARLADSGADNTTLDSMEVGGPSGDDGTIDVITTQVLRADRMPAVVTQFHRGDLRIRREERWEPIVDGSATATVTGSILDSPASLTGTAVLEPARRRWRPVEIAGHRRGAYPAGRRQAGELHRQPTGRAADPRAALHHDVDRRKRLALSCFALRWRSRP